MCLACHLLSDSGSGDTKFLAVLKGLLALFLGSFSFGSFHSL